MEITSVWLKREELEDGDNADAVVLIEYRGEWIEIIRERLSGNFSHICEEGGFESARLKPLAEAMGPAYSEQRREFIRQFKHGVDDLVQR